MSYFWASCFIQENIVVSGGTLIDNFEINLKFCEKMCLENELCVAFTYYFTGFCVHWDSFEETRTSDSSNPAFTGMNHFLEYWSFGVIFVRVNSQYNDFYFFEDFAQ